MNNDLPVQRPEWALWPDAPDFIKPVPEMQGQTSNPCELFDFWSPERTCDDVLDFERGQAHCLSAIAFARSMGGGGNVISNIIGGMYRTGAGAIERGFIETLSRKATYGSLPAPISDDAFQGTVRLCGRSEDELRYGETEAQGCLLVARECQYPELIADLMVNAVNLEMGRGSLTFIWTVCGAAVLGSMN